MTVFATDAVMADSVSMLLVGLMWALSLAALAGVAYLMGKWLRNREERRKRPVQPQRVPRPDRKTVRSVKKAQRRQDNASDLDGYL